MIHIAIVELCQLQYSNIFPRCEGNEDLRIYLVVPDVNKSLESDILVLRRLMEI